MNLILKMERKYFFIYSLEKGSVDPMVCTFFMQIFMKYPIDMVLGLSHIIKSAKLRRFTHEEFKNCTSLYN